VIFDGVAVEYETGSGQLSLQFVRVCVYLAVLASDIRQPVTLSKEEVLDHPQGERADEVRRVVEELVVGVGEAGVMLGQGRRLGGLLLVIAASSASDQGVRRKAPDPWIVDTDEDEMSVYPVGALRPTYLLPASTLHLSCLSPPEVRRDLAQTARRRRQASRRWRGTSDATLTAR